MADGDPKNDKTLREDDIVTEDGASRREALGKLAGLAAASAIAAVTPGCYRRYYGPGYGARHATGITDSDGGPYADPAGYGRGGARGMVTGVTDSDAGPYADPPGQGRGRYGYASGITDSDSGAYADPAGNGRGTARLGYTGVTDSDGGAYADPAGHGRGRWR